MYFNLREYSDTTASVIGSLRSTTSAVYEGLLLLYNAMKAAAMVKEITMEII
jgi:hypothetical protein